MIAVPNRQPDDRPPPRSDGRPLTVSIHLAVSALVLTTILLTAAASSLLWWRTAEATSRQLASTINEQIVVAVRKEVSAIVGEARAAHTAIRTLFLQNVLDTREADKREFVFLSQLQSHATISWVAFGWPDGSFFAAHKLGDGHLEMMEISLTDHPGQRRIDEYAVIPGDIEFEQRQFVPTDFHVVGPGSRPAWGPRDRNSSRSWTIRSENVRHRLCGPDRRLPGAARRPRDHHRIYQVRSFPCPARGRTHRNRVYLRRQR
jgi:hypothetical protein